MPLRKRANKDAAGGTTQPTAGERSEEISDDSEVEFLSLSPATSQSKRKRKAKSKVAPKELTEEEMFDLAVRLSEQEASDAARRRQQEEDEALQRAIEESMSQTQPLPPSRSPSPPLDRVLRRRRLEFCSDDPGPSARLEVTSQRSCSDDPGPSARLEVTSQRSCRADTHPELLDRKGPGGNNTNNNNRTKRKRNDEDSSPLPEMPDLSQTQKIFTQSSPFPSSSFSQPSEPLSTQDFDCTQHESSQLPPPPVSLRDSSVSIPKMSRAFLATCQSGSISCSQQENFMSSLPSRPKTPTCTKKGLSPTADSALPQSPTFPRSPVFSGGQREQDSRSSTTTTSPVFGRTSQNLGPPPTPKFSDGPALSKNVVPAETGPSPTFLGSQGLSKNPCLSESHLFDKSDIFSVADDVDFVDTQPQSQDYSTTSPVFGEVSQNNKKPSLVCKPNRSPSNAASPTFPRSADNVTESSRPLPKSLLLSESDPEDDVLIEQGHTATSPVFGRPSQNQRPSLACKPNLSGSPTFPKDPAVSKTYPNIPNTPTFSRSPRTPVFSETNSEEDEVKVQGVNTTSPVFGRTGQGHRPSLACKPNITLSRSPTAPRSQTDSESVISSKSLTFPKSPLFSDTEKEEDSDWTSWKSKISLSPVFPAERALLRPSIHTFSPNYKLGPRHRGTRRDVEGGGGACPGPSAPCASTRRLHQPPGRGDKHHHQGQNSNEPRPGPSQGLARRLPAHTLEAGGGVMVCYCWGIPFCPRGRDPDTYTEVIVEQLEFYEKSLKRAQRGLLRKMEWSDPILPQPEKAPSPESSAESTIRRPTRRRGLRLRPKRRAKSTSASSPEKEEEEEEEEEEKNIDKQDNNKEDHDFKLTMVTSDEEDDNGDDKSKDGQDDNKEDQEGNKNNEQDEQEQGATAADEDDTDCEEVCPETQLDPDDETQVLIMPTSQKAEPRSPSQSRSESQTVLPVRLQSPEQRRTPGEMSESQTVLPVRPQSTDQRRTPEEMSESQTVLPVRPQSTDQRQTPGEMSESQTVLPVRLQSPEQRQTPGEMSESQTVLPVRPQSTDQRRTPGEMSESQTVLPVRPQSTDQRRTPEEMDIDAPADEEKEPEDMIVASPDGGQDERMEEEREEFNTTFLERPSESWTAGSPIKENRTGEEEEEEMMTTALQVSSSPPCSPQGQASSTMACPLCQASFPLDQIEMHAATCYGGEEEEEGGGGGGGGHFYSTAADHFPASPRPKRARNRGLTAEETAAHSSSTSSVRNRGLTEEASHSSSSAARLFEKKEKCYICHKAVPSSEFGRHTEKCIRQQTSRSEQRGGGGGGGGGDLLSALEQTESREPTEAGPSGVNYKEVIDLSGHEEEEEESEDVLCHVSDSPIRAFTSVSEASDCLVDFKKQLNPRSPPRREPGKRGRGRGRGGGGRRRRGGGRGASRGRAVKRKYTR